MELQKNSLSPNLLYVYLSILVRSLCSIFVGEKCCVELSTMSVVQCVRHRGDICWNMFVVVWCLALWLLCLCLVVPSC